MKVFLNFVTIIIFVCEKSTDGLVLQNRLPQLSLKLINSTRMSVNVFFKGLAKGRNSGIGRKEDSFEISDDELPPLQSSILPPALIALFGNLFASYSELLAAHSYPTRIISSAIIGSVGDILIQQVERMTTKKTPKPFSIRRVFVFALVAAFYIAPVIACWFDWLSAAPFLSGMAAEKKAFFMMLLDQTFGAVIINFFFFFAFELAQKIVPPYKSGAISFLESGWLSAKSNIWDTLVANWKCWPIINYFNFLYVPVEFRLLVSNLVSIFWNMFLSSMANREVSGGANANKDTKIDN